jgi:hypothetical protein
MAIKVGDVLKDNDPRSAGRLLYVRKLSPGHVHAATAERERLTRIRADRIHEDDKPRRTGYSVVKSG